MEPRCSDCPLNGSVKVLGKGTGGNDHYDIVGVGIAPARVEVEKGSPFVGWSGTVLREVLKKLGLVDFYLTNTMLCELPEGISVKDRNLAISCCKERLLEEIRSKKPELILALGNVPLETLTGVDYKIRSINGRILPHPIAPIVPVIHPASLKRRPEEFYDFVDGLKSARKYQLGTYEQAVIPKTIVVDESNIAEILQMVENAGLVAVDLETTGRGFFPYDRDPDKIRCIALAVGERTAYIVPGESSPYFDPHPNYTQDPRLKEVLSKVDCVFHNGPFDIGFLKQVGYNVRIFFDTFLAHYMLDEREYSHSLKDLGHKYLGAPDWEDDIKEFLPHKSSSYDLIPDNRLYEYASHDVVYTYQLSEGKDGFRKKVGDQFIYKELIMPCANMFSELRHIGLRLDVGYLMELDEVLEKDLQESEEELSELVGYPANPFSPPEISELLYDKLGYKEIPRYGRSTNKKVLELLGGPVCEKIQECRELGKLKSTYVVGVANFLDRNFRIHPLTKLHGAVTGRISTEDPSVMNIKKTGGIKKLYLPEEGHYIAELDQKTMEMRCYAVIAEDEQLKRLLLEGKDPHRMVAQELAKRRKIDWDALSDTDKTFLRQRCKSGMFGRMGGMQLESYQFSYRLDTMDASLLVSVIDSIVPTLKDYRRLVSSRIHKDGYLESYFGRKRRFGLILDENKYECYRQGMNFYFQSMASDINLFCMLHLYNLRDKLGATPLFPVHDSIVMDINDLSVLPEIDREVKEYSKELVNGEMEFKVDIAVGPNWGETKLWKQ